MSGKGESKAMVTTLTVVAMICGMLIVSAFQWTKPVIAKNKAARLQASVFDVLPGIAKTKRLDLPGDDEAHAGYAEDGSLVGVAIQAEGQGFQDVIRVIYGYSPAKQAIIGFKVLDSKETPGLGDRIETDPAFLANFTALDATLTPEGALANPFVAVKSGKKTQPWQIDGITGATISSKAIARLMSENAARELPKVREAVQ